eukprot:scaffold147123_cov19-Tisochrysis_lutea.AAC.5
MEEEIAAGGIEFDAEFFHQHFGQDDEGETQIKGYKDLRINLWMSAQTYHTWLDIQYSQRKKGADKLEKHAVPRARQNLPSCVCCTSVRKSELSACAQEYEQGNVNKGM